MNSTDLSQLFQSDSNSFCNEQDTNNRALLQLNSFAAFLSSAMSVSETDPVHPRPEPRLATLLSPHVHFDTSSLNNSHTVCSFPTLSLKNTLDGAGLATTDMSLQDTTALKLAIPMFVDPKSVSNVPVMLLNNVSESLMALIDARLRSTISALARQCIKGSDSTRPSKRTFVLLSLLGNSPVTLKTIVTSFRIVPSILCDSFVASGASMPLVLSAVVDLSVFGKLTTVSFEAPGTITGNFNNDFRFERLEVNFDCISLLSVMMKEARTVVKKVVTQAVSISDILVPENQNILPRVLSKSGTGTGMKRKKSVSFANLDDHEYTRSSKIPRHDMYLSTPHITATMNGENVLSSVMQGDHNYCDNNREKEVPVVEKSSEPYQLFSWLKGDKMLLNNEDDHGYLQTQVPTPNISTYHTQQQQEYVHPSSIHDFLLHGSV